MHRGIVGLAAALALFAGACSGATDADETEAVASAEPSETVEPAGPAEVDRDEGTFSPTVERTETTSDADSDSGSQAPNPSAEDDDDEESEADATDFDDESNEDDDSDSDEESEDADEAGESEDSDSDSDDDDSEDSDSDSDDMIESVVDRSRPLTGPGSASAASAFTLVPVEQGSNGEDVLALQSRLAELGFAPGTPDGSYGRRTIAAVEAFQGLVDLDVTGDADADTIKALITYRYDGLVLRAGDDGDDVETLQLRLSEGPFDPGPIDGSYGTGTKQAVWALEKMAGIPVDGDWGPLDEKAWQQLLDGEIGAPEKEHETRWVEVDLSEQVMKVYDPESTTPVLISHASSGSGIPWSNEEHSGSSVTPRGDFTITRRINGWRESSLNIGRLYNPLYFNGGIAFHGATSVPLYPASHGCIRLPMHVAEYLPDELPNGTPVHVLG